MKNLIYCLFCLLPLSCAYFGQDDSCSECPDGLETASIIAQDFRRCVCCGGWFITVGPDTLRTLVLPAEFEIAPDPALPIDVCLSYHALTGTCEDFAALIEIDRIELK